MRNRFILAALCVALCATFASSQDVNNPAPWARSGANAINTNSGSVGVGNPTFGFTTDTGQILAVSGESTVGNLGILGIGGNITNTANAAVGAIAWYNTQIGGSDKRVAQIYVTTDGATNSGRMNFATWNSGVFTVPMVLYTAGGVAFGSGAATLAANEIGLKKMTASGTAPGTLFSKLSVVCGTNAGTAKLIMYAGTSTTSVTIVDNVGTGVSGC